MSRTRIVIMGAAGRDFHNFLTAFRNDGSVEVVAFTANQIPGIDCRTFPAELAGPLYPSGIPVRPESELRSLIHEHGVQQVVFAYSDVTHEAVMHNASLALAEGCDFVLLGPDRTMVRASVPVISVCAVRTGVGKSGISRRVWENLMAHGLRAVDVRHPMPYGDLVAARVQRFASIEDMDAAGVTLEEREEYEHLVELGAIVYAGVDYEAIVREAEKEADVIIWDGGNNDMPFIWSDLEIVALDPHRPGHERLFHPGEANFLRADVLVVNKVDSARADDVDAVVVAAATYNPDAPVLLTRSGIIVDQPESLAGKRVLVIEDGPTVTHGGMAYGAGALAARQNGARLVDPRPHAVGSIASTLAAFPHLTDVLPAMGYSAEQLADLEASVRATPCDLVVVGTPIDLRRLIDFGRPSVRVTYRVEDAGSPTLDEVVDGFLREKGLL